MNTPEDKSDMITPRQLDYWELTYRELVITPDWPGLNAEDRARKLLEIVDAKLHEADAPPQSKALLGCSEEQRLEAVREMIVKFENVGGK